MPNTNEGPRLAALAALRARASRVERAAVFPYAMVVLGFIVFIPLYVGLHAAWPTFHSVAQSGTTNPDALVAIHWYDVFLFPIFPFVFLGLAAVYFNIRANRDAGRY